MKTYEVRIYTKTGVFTEVVDTVTVTQAVLKVKEMMRGAGIDGKILRVTASEELE